MDLAYSAYTAFYLYLVMLLVQWMLATFSKVPNAISGKIDDSLSHGSFVFRAHRTFHNTLENSALFIRTILFAFILNYPSPRSYFFLIGVLANLVILVTLGLRLA
ncbi:MAPEG family protein [Paraglaciecola marina]|uniref:MAPEG family protein n=1 Tax=Paraglaciecola marina TaxID=2500157 RepID=UPI0030843B48